MTTDSIGTFEKGLRELVRVSGVLATYCDHIEHNEPVDRAELLNAGSDVRNVAIRLFEAAGKNPITAYAERLGRVESRYPQSGAGGFDGRAAIAAAKTWRDLQQAQALHDATYHADVLGMSKLDQLRHYTFHMSKLAWQLQEALIDEAQMLAFLRDRLPDTLLFGIKLATVVGIKLPNDRMTGV